MLTLLWVHHSFLPLNRRRNHLKWACKSSRLRCRIEVSAKRSPSRNWSLFSPIPLHLALSTVLTDLLNKLPKRGQGKAASTQAFWSSKGYECCSHSERCSLVWVNCVTKQTSHKTNWWCLHYITKVTHLSSTTLGYSNNILYETHNVLISVLFAFYQQNKTKQKQMSVFDQNTQRIEIYTWQRGFGFLFAPDWLKYQRVWSDYTRFWSNYVQG